MRGPYAGCRGSQGAGFQGAVNIIEEVLEEVADVLDKFPEDLEEVLGILDELPEVPEEAVWVLQE